MIIYSPLAWPAMALDERIQQDWMSVRGMYSREIEIEEGLSASMHQRIDGLLLTAGYHAVDVSGKGFATGNHQRIYFASALPQANVVLGLDFHTGASGHTFIPLADEEALSSFDVDYRELLQVRYQASLRSRVLLQAAVGTLVLSVAALLVHDGLDKPAVSGAWYAIAPVLGAVGATIAGKTWNRSLQGRKVRKEKHFQGKYLRNALSNVPALDRIFQYRAPESRAPESF